MHQIIINLKKIYPQLNFVAGYQFYWSPESSEIYFKQTAAGKTAIWSLLHETGHALLEHASYKADFELIRLEVAAWERATYLAHALNLKINEDHIQDCLDTYRDWLYKRSICPNCSTKCLQLDDHAHYHCFNCHMIWRVSTSRFCRAYRSTKNLTKSSDYTQEAPYFS